MSDFAFWLKNNNTRDIALNDLKQFADAHRADWPYDSNRMADYVRVVLAAHDPNEATILASLERYYLDWGKSEGGWKFLSAEMALVLTGIIVAIVIAVALFYTDLLGTLSEANHARGLITFLFSFITIAVIFIVVIALLWMDASDDLDNRFSKAKDIIAILVGILGTIVGFYFGSAPTSGQPPQPSAVTSTSNAASARPNGSNTLPGQVPPAPSATVAATPSAHP